VSCSPVTTADLTTLLWFSFHPQESLPVVAKSGAAVARNDGDSRLLVDLEPVPAIRFSKRHGDDGAGDHAPPYAKTLSSSFKEPARVADRRPLSGPGQLAASTGFAWAKKPRSVARSSTAAAAVTKRSYSKGSGTKNNSSGGGDRARTTSAATATEAAAPYEVEKQEVIKQWAQAADAFSASEAYSSRFRQTLAARQLKNGKVSLSQLTVTSIADLQCSAVLSAVSLTNLIMLLNFVALKDNLGIRLLFSDVQGEGEQGGPLRAAAVTAPAHRRIPAAQPRAAGPASWSPAMVQERCLAY
jgi:hypothetical protein